MKHGCKSQRRWGYCKMEIDYLTTPVNQGGLGGKIVNQGNNLWKVIW
jgi:hypothetical protein